MASYVPGYVSLGADELERRARELQRAGSPCRWCPRRCSADRLGGEAGQCGAGRDVVVSNVALHFGEEDHFVGRGGSGTVFFSCCNLGCIFCQNYEISHWREGVVVSHRALAHRFRMLGLQGAENLNLVTPSHFPADILLALAYATADGLNLPLVWNSSGYDDVDTLQYFDGVVDVYMPDFKFASDELGARLTQVADYATVACAALFEMVRQVGSGLTLEDGVAKRGMSVRHLVLPGRSSDSCACLEFLAGLGAGLTVNVMRQYHPAFQAHSVPGLDRGVSRQEYAFVLSRARQLGLVNVLTQ